jgi:hypothetical protein
MGHLRHPIKYELRATATNAERHAVRKALADEFQRILRLMITGVPTFPEALPTSSPGFFFPRGSSLATIGKPSEQEYRFNGNEAIYLRLFPKSNDAQPRLDKVGLGTLLHNRRALKAMSASPMAGLPAQNSYGYVVFEPQDTTTTRGITQVFLTGELWGINSQVFYLDTVVDRGSSGLHKRASALGGISAEKIYVRTLENYVSVAVSELKLRLPFVLEIGAVGLKDAYIAARHPAFPHGYLYEPIHEPSLVRRYELPNVSREPLYYLYGPISESSLVRRYELPNVGRETLYDALRRFFNDLYNLAECSPPDALTDEYFHKYDLPERT